MTGAYPYGTLMKKKGKFTAKQKNLSKPEQKKQLYAFFRHMWARQ